MVNIPITKNPEYLDIMRFSLLKGKIRSYELTKKFNAETNNHRANFSGKIQRLEKIGFLQSIRTASRGRHGKYSEYEVNLGGLYAYFVENYINIEYDLKAKFELLCLGEDPKQVAFIVQNTIKSLISIELPQIRDDKKGLIIYSFPEKIKDLDTYFKAVRAILFFGYDYRLKNLLSKSLHSLL